MDSSTNFSTLLFLSFLTFILTPIADSGANSNLFAEYIGAQFTGVKFSNVPINSGVKFHFILSFAIDYTDMTKPTPTNGRFGVFWDTDNLSPNAVSAIKQKHSNVKVAVSLGGYSVGEDTKVSFTATSVKSWVRNAVSSLTNIIQKYHLDGIDVDYEHFSDEEDTETFTECIGQLITTLKINGVISFASIAPFADPTVQSMYTALWSKYSSIIDYVNFQFYGYDNHTTVNQYVRHYDEQVSNYPGGKVLASFMSDTTGSGDGEFQPISADTCYNACKKLKSKCKLFGIFIWSADSSLPEGFSYEKKSQTLLAS